MNETNKNIVLIIDDETANIIALTNILSPEYEVYAAKNGKDAIELAKENLPDLILLDVIMPDMDGYEVISALKNSDITMSVPVIFITGLSNIDAEKKG
ncbi:MAG: response regulator, partial [Lachnospiraceae bacterium]|nr:response regulator [Lachnospiraceae bacterium]